MSFKPITKFMDQCLALASKAKNMNEVPVGAIVVLDGKIISEAYNQPRATHDPTAHAEILAMRKAALLLGTDKLINCDLWVTLEPCTMCAGAISHARIRRLYYAVSDIKGGAVESGVRFFNASTCHHKPEVYSGIRETAAKKMLKNFFMKKR